MTAAENYRDTDANWIPSIAHLYDPNNTLFAGFEAIDDYLRAEQNNSDKTDLIDVITTTTGMSLSAASTEYHGNRATHIWDNIFTQYILAENAALRTEETRCLRLTELIKRLDDGDTALDTGEGIWSAYRATVLLPETIFPLEEDPLAAEPDTPTPAADPEVVAAAAELEKLEQAVNEIEEAYSQQVYEYRGLKHKNFPTEPESESLPDLITHDALTLEEGRAETTLSSQTKGEVLSPRGIRTDYLHVPATLEKLRGEMRKLGQVVRRGQKRAMVIRSGGSLIRLDNLCNIHSTETPCNPYTGESLPSGTGNVRPIGIADLKVVQSQLLKYEQGEIAHIENVLLGETKKRTFRNLDRTETTTLVEQETTKESERETQTTERFAMQKEASNVIQQDQQNQAGVSISASYGPTASGTAYFDTGSSTSQAEANAIATDYAKEVTERALDRVIERTRTQRQVTTIIEHEDTSLHELTNAEGTDHVVGVYRWLDKLYYNKVVNYGKRLMFEVIIPEPAAFHLFSKVAKPNSEDSIQPPEPFMLNSFEEITQENYDDLAVQYGAFDIKPPPEPQKTVSHSHEVAPSAGEWNTWTADAQVPDGYEAFNARLSILLSIGGSPQPNYVSVMIGGRWAHTHLPLTQDVLLDMETNSVPIICRTKSAHFVISVEVMCQPTAHTMEQWRIDTFAALQTAYQVKLDEYNRWLNQQNVGFLINGNNPGKNRDVEQAELKKHCISIITGQRFESFAAMQVNVPDYGHPEFRFDDAKADGKYIQFFEQAFEWDQMTYLFYDYFWARKREWVNVLKRKDNDPLFEKFLQAGAARVLLPVRPAYTKALLHYLASGGEIWEGEDVPTPNDPLYVSIVDEIKEADGLFEGGEPEGEPWISKVPTSLVYLNHTGSPDDLPDYSDDLLPTP